MTKQFMRTSVPAEGDGLAPGSDFERGFVTPGHGQEEVALSSKEGSLSYPDLVALSSTFEAK